MRLTLFTDYALRILMFLASRPGELSTIREIAERYQISENHLMKIVHQLGKDGFVETVRGRQGGLRLALRELQKTTCSPWRHRAGILGPTGGSLA